MSEVEWINLPLLWFSQARAQLFVDTPELRLDRKNESPIREKCVENYIPQTSLLERRNVSVNWMFQDYE
jgi:hypothetical protein